MRARLVLLCAAIAATGTFITGQAPKRLNPMIELMTAKKPVFGLYAPSNRRFGGPGGQASTPAPAPKSAAQLAAEAMANSNTDYIFDGSMEGGMARALPAFTDFVKGMAASGSFKKKN